MSGSIQSSNYVPGVSGWKLNPGGDFEINSSSIAVGSLPTDQQPITITAGNWSDYDLPANAVERHAFIGAELEKIPAECRDSAEFTTEDISFDRDGSDYRTTLTYVRQETQEEAKARNEKAKVAGTRTVRAGGCTTVIVDGVVRYRIGNLDAPLPEPEQPKPFKVDGDKVYISEAFVDDGSITKAKITDEWSVMIGVAPDGKKYAAGMGVGIGQPSRDEALDSVLKGWTSCAKESSEFDNACAKGADAVLELLAGKIDETKLGQDLKEQIEQSILTQADKVRDVIRAELRQGGLLWRRL